MSDGMSERARLDAALDEEDRCEHKRLQFAGRSVVLNVLQFDCLDCGARIVRDVTTED
jgi:hypothetical protein